MDNPQQTNTTPTASSVVDSFAKWSQSISRSSRTAIAIVFVLIALVLINSSGFKTAPTHCGLLNDCQLTANEIQRIEFVLNKSGFDQFEVVDGMIRVPQSERAAYLKLLTDENALPVSLQQGTENKTAGLNPFLTRNQQLVAERAARKKQIEQMLGRLPFVEQAWFQMDSVRSTNAFQGPKVSALASIQPALQRSLNAHQVNTIRQIIAGSFAALGPEQIVITDLIAGNAYHHSDSQLVASGQNVSHASRQLNLAERRGHYESQISSVLKPFPGVSFEIDFESYPNPAWTESKQDAFASHHAEQPRAIEAQPKTEPAAATWGMNGQASVESPVRQASFQQQRTSGDHSEHKRPILFDWIKPIASLRCPSCVVAATCQAWAVIPIPTSPRLPSKRKPTKFQSSWNAFLFV